MDSREVVAGYAAAVALDQPKQPDPGDPLPPVVSDELWFIALVASPILLVLLALVAKNLDALVRRAVLAPSAFALWSASVPHGWWERFDGFTGKPGDLDARATAGQRRVRRGR